MRKTSAKPTVTDVARMAGVAPITVSRAVNGTAKVSPEKMKRIEAAVRKLQYQPNEAARILKGRPSRMIGLILPKLSDPFFSTCAAAIEQFAFDRGYTTLILTSRPSDEGQVQEVDTLIRHHVAGVVIVPSTDETDVKRLDTRGIPIVAMDRPMLGAMSNKIDEVMVQNSVGAKMAVDHLLFHGHKHIACLANNFTHTTIRDRIKGYQSSIRRAGLTPEVHRFTNVMEDTRKLVDSWVKAESSRPTAIFTVNGPGTQALLECLHDSGLEIPKDIALICFDDFELAPLMKCPLTTVRQPIYEMGSQVAQLLFKRIEAASSTHTKAPAKLALPVNLIIRKSCGCL